MEDSLFSGLNSQTTAYIGLAKNWYWKPYMDLKRLFPAWQRGALPADREQLFSQKLIFIPVIGMSFAYPSIAALNPNLLARIDEVLSPAIDALQWIGLGIVKPPMDGPFPVRLYLNETGIAVWAAVIYNVVLFIYLIVNRRPFSRDPEKSLQRLIDKNQWGRTRAWLALRFAVYVFSPSMAIYCTACLLNGIHGWFVFHVVEYSVVPFPTLVFVLPGAFAGMMWLALLEYFIYDISSLFKLISSFIRS